MTDDEELARFLKAALEAFPGTWFTAAEAGDLDLESLPRGTQAVRRRQAAFSGFKSDPAKSMGRWLSHRAGRTAGGLTLSILTGSRWIPNQYRVVE